MLTLPLVKDTKKLFPNIRITAIRCLFRVISVMISIRSCCLYKCADEMGNDKKNKKQHHTNYTYLLRFFKMKKYEEFCKFIGKLIFFLYYSTFKGKVNLVLDRTNWKIGKTNINILFLGILTPENIFIPLIWVCLDKRGNSNENERIALFEEFLSEIKTIYKVEFTILGDREFIGIKWIKWLNTQNISFVLRLRITDYLQYIKKKTKSKNKFDAKKLKNNIAKQVKKYGFFCAKMVINGVTYHYYAFADSKKKQAFASFISPINHKKVIQNLYKKRWKIECFFKHIKTNGFNVEDMNLTESGRIMMMMGVVSLGYATCIKIGLQENQTSEIQTKTHLGKKWKAISFFRLGLRYIDDFSATFETQIKEITTKIPHQNLFKHTFFKDV